MSVALKERQLEELRILLDSFKVRERQAITKRGRRTFGKMVRRVRGRMRTLEICLSSSKDQEAS